MLYLPVFHNYIRLHATHYFSTLYFPVLTDIRNESGTREVQKEE